MKESIQQTLLTYLKTLPESSLKQSAIYAIQAGGKRFRPLVILSMLKSYGYEIEPYLPVAASIEMIHLYSLIHDDLPAMDNDHLRHGVPTIHKQFNERIAILLGDGLLTNAFEMITTAPTINDAQKVKIVHILATRAGLNGMVFGQHLDLEAEGKQVDLEMLIKISQNKTGKLLEAAFRIGAILSSPKDEEVWGEIGLTLGLMFQIQDDVLEVIKSEEELQKSKSDDKLNKATFVSQLGLAPAQTMIEKLFEKVTQNLGKITLVNPAIKDLINTIYARRY
jgi:geranylgeranyl diphosphate synthase, type II